MLANVIAFDAYGTLCFIESPTDPYRGLLNSLSVSATVLRQELMTKPRTVQELANQYDLDDDKLVAMVEQLVAQEVASVKIYPDVIETLKTLKRQGFKLVIVSNLAYPYAEPLVKQFSGLVDYFLFSFAVGVTKPDPKIFQALCETVNVQPDKVVMVGDSWRADVQGARDFGMQAIHVDRNQSEKEADCITTIHPLLERVKRIM